MNWSQKYECTGINSKVSAAVFGGHFDTELMQYQASRMVNMVARYNRLPDMARADIDLLAADIANFIRSELANIDDSDFASSEHFMPGICTPGLSLSNLM